MVPRTGPTQPSAPSPDPLLEAACSKAYSTVVDQLGPAFLILFDALAALVPPPELVNVMRMPIGPAQVIAVTVGGRISLVRVEPIGRNDPKAERIAWTAIRENVLAERRAA